MGQSGQAAGSLELAGAVCARLCHDLAGTLGALAGMLDMAGEDAEALALARASAGELAARLKLLRAAWASDSDVEDLAVLAAGLPGADRLRVQVEALGEAPVLRRLAASALLVAASGLPRGGTIHLGPAGAGLRLRIDGPRAGWPEWLTTPGPPEAGSVAGTLLALQAEAAGLALHIASSTELRLA